LGAPGGDEPRRGGAEHELEHLPALAAHLQPPALFVYGQHDTSLEAAAEMGDPCLSADAGERS
jgi:hypothetical protein